MKIYDFFFASQRVLVSQHDLNCHDSFLFLSTQIEAWFNEPQQTFPKYWKFTSSVMNVSQFVCVKKREIIIEGWSPQTRPKWSECLIAIIKYFYFFSQKRSTDKNDEQLGEGFYNNDSVWFNWYKLDHKSKLICASDVGRSFFGSNEYSERR